jgi:signal transduction histidine kinase
VHEIAKAHGGRAEVDSSEERGTTFRAIFPKR